jgi:hypothetical protein
LAAAYWGGPAAIVAPGPQGQPTPTRNATPGVACALGGGGRLDWRHRACAELAFVSPKVGPESTSARHVGTGAAVGAMVTASHAMPHDAVASPWNRFALEGHRKTMAPQSPSTGFLQRPTRRQSNGVHRGGRARDGTGSRSHPRDLWRSISSPRWKPEMVPLRCDPESRQALGCHHWRRPRWRCDATSRVPPLIWVATVVPPLRTRLVAARCTQPPDRRLVDGDHLAHGGARRPHNGAGQRRPSSVIHHSKAGPIPGCGESPTVAAAAGPPSPIGLAFIPARSLLRPRFESFS